MFMMGSSSAWPGGRRAPRCFLAFFLDFLDFLDFSGLVARAACAAPAAEGDTGVAGDEPGFGWVFCSPWSAAGHGNACQCVEIRRALLRRFGKADVVDLILQHYYGACGWGTARFDAGIHCVQYGPAGDVVAASDSDGRIHFICAQTGEALLCPLRGHSGVVRSVCFSSDGKKLTSGSADSTARNWNPATRASLS